MMFRRTLRRHGLLWVCAVVTLQCSDTSGVEQQLIRSFTIMPATVVSGDSLKAILSFENPTAHAIGMTGLYSCPAFLFTFRGTTEVELEGSRFACPPAVTEFRVESRSALTITYVMRARVRTPGSAEAYLAAPAGTYRTMADLNMSLPDLEAPFVVVPTALSVAGVQPAGHGAR